MIEMLLTGSMLTMALYTLVLGVVRRDRVLLLLSGFIAAQLMQDLAFQGFLYRHVLVEGGNWVLRGPSLWSAIATALFSAMAMAFAGLQRVPLWRWAYRILIAAACVCALGSVFGDYRASATALIDLLFVCNAVWVVSMLDGWRRRIANAPLFLLAFAGNSVPLLVRLLVIHGVLPDLGLSASGIAWSTNLSMLLMISMLVVSRSRQLLRQQREAQQALLDVRSRERERLERAVDERTRDLQAALIAADEASSAKSDFLARVSHDLRSPLTSIIGFADLVQAAGREDAERGRIIRRSASHMLAMVNDLIDYAGGADPDALRPAPVYVHALLESIAQEGASLAAKRGNHFSLEMRGPLPPIMMLDDKRLRQVLGNLIDNAAKFTRAGSIVLSVECGEALPGGIVTVTFAVADTGQGIAAADHERIFEPFARLDAARLQPGIGLGLPIVRQWVERMGGTLAIESTPAVGTRVSIALALCPVAENDISRHFVADATGVLPAIDGGGRRIWIAEDTAEIRDFLTDELASLGFEVESEGDGRAMIERIASGGAPGPDLIMTDHMMPDADGIAVLAAARCHLPGVPVMVLSAVPQAMGAGGAREGERAMRGYDASLLKPVNLAELRNTLARLLTLARIPEGALAGEALVSPAAAELAGARRLIDLGAISDLIDWAEALGARVPACRAFTQQAGVLARMGDLEALRALCRG